MAIIVILRVTSFLSLSSSLSHFSQSSSLRFNRSFYSSRYVCSVCFFVSWSVLLTPRGNWYCFHLNFIDSIWIKRSDFIIHFVSLRCYGLPISCHSIWDFVVFNISLGTKFKFKFKWAEKCSKSDFMDRNEGVLFAVEKNWNVLHHGQMHAESFIMNLHEQMVTVNNDLNLVCYRTLIQNFSGSNSSYYEPHFSSYR